MSSASLCFYSNIWKHQQTNLLQLLKETLSEKLEFFEIHLRQKIRQEFFSIVCWRIFLT